MTTVNEQTERETVEWFSGEMLKSLGANSHSLYGLVARPQRVWGDLTLLWLCAKLVEEVGEVGGELNTLVSSVGEGYNFTFGEGKLQELIGECSDVANIAMMIADNLRKLIPLKLDT